LQRFESDSPVMHAVLIRSPIGPLYVEAEDGRLTRLYTDGHPASARANEPPTGVLHDVKAQLDEYFAGTRTMFDLPLGEHGTPFEHAVWAKLREIPYGATRTYGEIAKELNSSPRAVGRANGRNQISIIVPCHRVIGANGSLTGYAGGIPTKQALLAHELVGAGRPSGPPGVAS
jgi:methylated-DNA-[protein]-cysteine S-methyltransferase